MSYANLDVSIMVNKYEIFRMHCVFNSYDHFNLVDQYLTKIGCRYDKMETTMEIPITKPGQHNILAEKIATFLESMSIKVNRFIKTSDSHRRSEEKVTSFLGEIENFNNFINGFATQTELGKIYGKSAITVGKALISVGLKDPGNKYPTDLACNQGMAIFLPLKNTNSLNIKWSISMTCSELDRLGWKKELPSS
jgi:hypothetical protein